MALAKPIPRLTDSDKDRFWKKVSKRGADCWPWLSVTAKGYGHFRLGDKK